MCCPTYYEYAAIQEAQIDDDDYHNHQDDDKKSLPDNNNIPIRIMIIIMIKIIAPKPCIMLMIRKLIDNIRMILILFLATGPTNHLSNFTSTPGPHQATMLSSTTAYENSQDLPNEHLKRSTKIFASPEVRFRTSPMRLTGKLRSLNSVKGSLGHLDAKLEAKLGAKLRAKLSSNSNFYNAQHADQMPCVT